MQWQTWLVLALAGLLPYVARQILPPFIIAGVIAYLLSPLVDALAARGLRRGRDIPAGAGRGLGEGGA